ncbi:MAG: DHA2 family efflux MFS transporter permease subunit [Candidatus Acidiferrales bacterium]
MNELFAGAKNEEGLTHPWLIAATVVIAVFMEVLDTSIANVALPHIAGNLSAGVDESTWVLTSYLVANAIVLPLSGWFSMLFGRKRFYMTCVALFTMSSFACGLAPNLGILVFFRILQGAGGGALQPVSQAILVESFPHQKRGMAMAMFGMGVVVAPIIGPTLGGWLTDNYSWRWIFLINIPVGVLSLLMTKWLIFDPPYLKRKTFATGLKIDYIGIGLLSVGLGFLQVVLDKGEREDWLSAHFIVGCAVLTVIGLVGALIWELHSKDPAVDFRLFKDRNLGVATFTMFMLGVTLYGSTMLLPFFLQILMGYTAMQSGLALSVGGLVVLICLPIVGRLLVRVEPRWLVIFGVLVVSMSLFHMAHFNLDIDFRTAMMARVYQSAGMAFLFVPINVMAFAFLAKSKVNNATGLINLARNVGGSVGIAMVTTLLARRTQFHQSILVGHMTPFDGSYRAALAGATQALMAGGSNLTQATGQAQALLYGMLQRHAAMLAFADDFWLMGIAFLVIIPLMFLMKKSRHHTGEESSLEVLPEGDETAGQG